MSQQRLLAFHETARHGRLGNIVLFLLGPVAGIALSFMLVNRMIHNPAPASFVFPLFSGVVLAVYLTSGPLWAFVMCGLTTVVGQLFFLFAYTGTAKLHYASGVLLAWLLFYLVSEIQKLSRNALSRTEEEFDRLDLDVSLLQSEKLNLVEKLQDNHERLEAHRRLGSFVDDLVGAYTRDELLRHAQKGLEDFFPGTDAAFRLFARPNSADMDDDWGHRALHCGQPRLFRLRKNPAPTAKDGGFMLIPLMSRDQFAGWVGLERKSRRRLFGWQDLRLATIAVDLVSLALGNADLYNETEALAITDNLTGLYSRGHFLERLEEEFAKARHNKTPLSLLLLDMDHFKLINDTFGHNRGDEVLRWMSRTLSTHMRETDLAGRFGGDEFIVLMPHTPGTRALQLAHRLFKSLDKTPFRWGEEKIPLHLSGGVASLNDTLTHPEDLIRLADSALYSAKKAGRNQVAQA